MSVDIQMALDLTTRIVACGLAVSALELLSIRHHFGREGVFNFGTISVFRRQLVVLRTLDRYIVFLLSLQFAASIALVALGPFSLLGRLLLALAFLATMAARWRRHIGGDGAEQMALLVLAAVGLALLPWPGSDRMVAATTFIAAQAGLSYLTAGVAKLISPIWRDGSALPAILSTYNHGHPWAAGFLHQHTKLAQLLCWSVITFECLFPVLVLGPSWLAVSAFICGFAFHAGCAVLMGLNGFLWSFPATYPCVMAAVAYWKVSV
ncbi:MAG: hypothetical protein M3437_15165 [Chloroflexota bacterium]|nr:hypothetical protein [Chloroflexota bacterium]